MKGKIIMAMAVVALTLVSGSAMAWHHCKAVNGHGVAFFGEGYDRSVAAGRAIDHCSNHSRYATNCRIVNCWR